MLPTSWYREQELARREAELRRAAARFRAAGHLRRRKRRKRD